MEAPDAVICVDQPVKNIRSRTDRSLFESAMVSATPKIDTEDVPLCGQLYCALSNCRCWAFHIVRSCF
jgi:hypothetical protein